MSRRHLRAVGGATISHEWLMTRDEAERVACPIEGCGAPIGKHCRNPTTGDPTNFPAHAARIRAANEPDQETE